MAIVERYVRADAAGSGDGTTDTNSGSNGAFTWAEMITDINTPRVGYRYNVKQGTYTLGSTTTLTGDGTTTSPNIIRGFKDSIGDATLGRGTDGLINTSNMPTISYTSSSFFFNANGSNYLIVESLIFTGNSNSALLTNNGTGSITVNCKATNLTVITGDGIENGSSSLIIGNDVYLPSGSNNGAEAISAIGPVCFNKVFLGPSGIGINLRNNANPIMFNTIEGGSIGINKNTSTQNAFCYFNTIVNVSGNGIDFPSASTSRYYLIGNHITGCAGYGINLNSGVIDSCIMMNRFRDNVSGNVSFTNDWTEATRIFEVTTDTSDSLEFVDSLADNFALNSTAPGFQKALLLQYMNIGANGTPPSNGTTVSPSLHPLAYTGRR